MSRGSASPAAAGGRRGGRAAGLLPASLVTLAAAAAAWLPLTLGEESAERTWSENVCVPGWGETAVVKWYVAVSPSYLCLRNGAGRVCVNYLGPIKRVVTTCSVLEPCFHSLLLACWGIYFSTCQFAASEQLLLEQQQR